MLVYIYESLRGFRKVFSHHSSWLVFSVLVLGFIGSSEIAGVSSFCRFWLLEVTGYHSLLRFFRSDTWSLFGLQEQWSRWVLAQNETVMVGQRVVLLGDHTQVPKDGTRMPGVVTLHQDSETQTKPSYFRGQYWGAIGLLIGKLKSPFCLPLALQIHQGRAQIEEDTPAEKHYATLGERLVTMALEWSLLHQRPSVLVLDAFFASKSVFERVDSVWSLKIKEPLVTVIVRAKKNYVAYFPAESVKERERGRPKTYGMKIKLMEMFDQSHLFVEKEISIYGKLEKVSLTTAHLFWKPTSSIICFVFAVTSRGPIILMCNSLQQNPWLALQLYCSRTRMETMFDCLKNVMNAFRFRFWSKCLPKASRKPSGNQDLKKPKTAHGFRVLRGAWKAQEGFVTLATIAQGLLQMIALKQTRHVWKQSHAFLRTKSRELPSEKTVKQLLAPFIVHNFVDLATGGTMREIRKHLFGANTLPSVQWEKPDAIKHAA